MRSGYCSAPNPRTVLAATLPKCCVTISKSLEQNIRKITRIDPIGRKMSYKVYKTARVRLVIEALDLVCLTFCTIARMAVKVFNGCETNDLKSMDSNYLDFKDLVCH